MQLFNLDLKFRDMPHAGDDGHCYITIVNGACPGARKEVNMKKTYKYENCTVNVHIPDDDYFQERLRKASENFMKKVISGGKRNGHSNTTRNIGKK